MPDQPRDMDGKFVARPKGTKKKTSIIVWIIRIIFLPIWLLYEITKWGIKSIKAGGNKRIFGIAGMGAAYLISLILFISAVNRSNSPEYIAAQTATSVQATATQEVIAAATNTQAAVPTNTPAPTNTPEPTPTPTQPPAPQVFSGSGDDVINIESVGAAIVDIEHSGGSNFIVESFDSGGNQIDLLVNTIGNYTGRIELDFLQGEATAMLQIQAGGSWSIKIQPLSLDILNSVSVPGTYPGSGDDVIYIDGNARTGTFEAIGESNFIVWTIGNARELAVNEIAPYSGKVIIPNGTLLLIIKAEGPWTASLE